MATFVKSVTDLYDEIMASGDPRIAKWFLLESPVPTLVLVAAYVLFVKKIGPDWMAGRKPFGLRRTMLLYNVAMVLANFYIAVASLKILLKPSSTWLCKEDDLDDRDFIKLAEFGWWYFVIKLVEFADTVFFVLRKKNNQISTLHVIHHAVVPICSWAGLRIEPGYYNYFFPLLNTIVHTVMYSYYALAALGPSIQKYLWWKKYLTTLQMLQFVMVFFYFMTLMALGCNVSKFIIYLNCFLAGLFLIMFYDYFRRTYTKRSKSVKSEQNGVHSTDSVMTNGKCHIWNGKVLMQNGYVGKKDH